MAPSLPNPAMARGGSNTFSNRFSIVISISDKIGDPNHGNSNSRPGRCNPLDRASLYRAASDLSRLRHKQVPTKFKQRRQVYSSRNMVALEWDSHFISHNYPHYIKGSIA